MTERLIRVVTPDEVEQQVDDPNCFRIFKQTTTKNEYHIYLGEYIEEGSKYFTIFHELDSVTAKDKVFFHLNNSKSIPQPRTINP